MYGTAVIKGIDVLGNALWVYVHNQRHAAGFGHLVTKIVHLLKFLARINVQQRKWRQAGIKGFARQVQHHCAVFADAIKHYRIIRLGHNLAHDVNALGFQTPQMIKARWLCIALGGQFDNHLTRLTVSAQGQFHRHSSAGLYLMSAKARHSMVR